MRSKYNLRKKIDELKMTVHSSFCFKQGAYNKKNGGNWSKLWSSFDNIQDSQSAIEEYLTEKRYTKLFVYGILQALIVQQDAMVHLEEAINIKVPKFEKFPELKEIRSIRNETVGHPSETKPKGKDSYKKGNVTYTSLGVSEDGHILEYQLWSYDGIENKSINIVEIIKQQFEILSSEIDRVIKKMNKFENSHKQQFKNDCLTQKIAPFSYLIQKLYSFEHERVHSKNCLKDIFSIYEEFKNGIKKRYNIKTLSNQGIGIPGVIIEIQKIDELLKRLDKMILMEKNVDVFNLDIYVESLESAFLELKDMAKEIDEKFESVCEKK